MKGLLPCFFSFSFLIHQTRVLVAAVVHEQAKRASALPSPPLLLGVNPNQAKDFSGVNGCW